MTLRCSIRSSAVPSKRGELEITDVNNAYIREGTMTFSCLEDGGPTPGTFDPATGHQPGSAVRSQQAMAAAGWAFPAVIPKAVARIDGPSAGLVGRARTGDSGM
jgi:hypothetical protein